MNFELTQEQLEIKEMVMKFAKNELIPVAQEYDEKHIFPMEQFKKAWELGLINTCIPVEYGGTGFSTVESVVITECLSYVMQKLKENGFVVKYTHPNLLFISWMHWVPTYVRNELKKKTGIIVDGYGNKIENTDAKNTDPNSKLFNKGQTSTKTVNTNYKSTDSYKPSGNSIYKADLLDKIKDKLG